MKYSVLMALLGTASAAQGEPENSVQTKQYDEYGPTEKVQNLMPRRYERSANSNYVDGVRVSRTTFYNQLEDQINLQTPDESRAAWQTTRDASRAAAAEQERFQLEHNQMVAKNYADDVAKTNEKKWKDAASRINMMNGGTTPFKTVTNAKLDSVYAQTSTPDESRAAWQNTRDASRAAAAEQERFQLEHNTMVAKNYADDVAKTNEKKWKDAASRINMMNGGTTPFKTVTNAKLDSVYAQQTDPLGPSDATFVPNKADAAATVATQQSFEATKTADVASRNAANTDAADSLKASVRHARNVQATSDVPYNPYPTREQWTGQPANRLMQVQSQYIDGSHPVSIYETNGADSNRDHKTAQTKGPALSKEQQGWKSEGNSHYWATDALARQQGWSNEINPWTKPLTFRQDDMPKAYSTYTSLGQQYAYDNEADKSFVPAKAEATNVVNTQKAFEAAKTADVEARNAANTAEAQAHRNEVGAKKNEAHKVFSNYYVYVPEEEMYINLETPVESYAAKADSLATVKQTVSTQLKTMDDWQAQHAANMKQWKDDAAFTFMVNHQEIKNLYEFD